MVTPVPGSGLADEEYDEIDRTLARIKGGEIPNVEALDGFLTALVICPVLVMPSEYMKIITNGETKADNLKFADLAEGERFYQLMMRYWNMINSTYRSGDIYMPFMLEDENGIMKGNDWANGFLRGTRVRHHRWQEIAGDEERGGPFVPIWALAYEHAENPEIRPYKVPVTAKQRESLIVGAIAGAKKLYDEFQKDSKMVDSAGLLSPNFGPKAGRNELCPCGSGKKFKKCCGQVAIH